MPSYRLRCRHTLALTLHFLTLLSVLPCYVGSFSLLTYIVSTGDVAKNIKFTHRRYIPDAKYTANVRFTRRLVLGLNSAVILTLIAHLTICCNCYSWLPNLLVCSGDIHPNPGPSISPNVSLDSESITSSTVSLLGLSNSLSIVHYNVQSILPKLDNLYTELKEFDILTFSETWLSNSTHSDDLRLPNYSTPERKDRQDGYGGVCVYVRNTLNYKRRPEFEITDIESIWIELFVKHLRILIGVFYRPPNSGTDYLNKIEDSIHLALDARVNDIMVIGDFNLNMLNHQSARKIHSICQQLGIHQIITEPTHFTENSSSLIDLLFVNNTHNLVASGTSDPFLNQHVRYHCPIFGIFKYDKPKTSSYKRTIWQYDKGDYDILRQNTRVTEWPDPADIRSVDANVEEITTKLNNLSLQCIPNKTVTIKPAEPPWITSHIKRKIRCRKRAYRKARKTNCVNHWKKFKSLRNEVISLIRIAKQEHTDKLTRSLSSSCLSPRDWWKTLKSFISYDDRPSIPALVHNGSLVSDDYEKSNLLNNFFASQTHLLEDNVNVPPVPRSESTLSSLVFTIDEVRSVLQSLPLGKASGPDAINNRVLRELSNELCNPLCYLFNKSLSTGSFPKAWKEAHVCAVFKKGDPAIASNYRPISLLSNLDKVLERLVFKRVYNFFLDNNFLTAFQSGFIPGDSTVNQLTYIYNSFCKALDEGKEIRAVFFDISKAFDRVWHRGLLAKLEGAGISGPLLHWFSEYLSHRKQRVVLPGVQSDWAEIKAGVPQGSILGPLLFLVYINDIVSNIQSNIRLFADDTSLYLIVEHANTAADTLNADIQSISDWAQTWLVSFNPLKTESLLISRKLNKVSHPTLTMLNQDISEVQSHKHLGVFLSNDGSWNSHIDYIKSKAWPRVNIMRKLKFVLDRKSLEKIYFCFVRPILEYADIAWDNCTKYQKEELDKIQHEAARIVTGTTKYISIRELNKETNWESLESRRQKHKLVLFYKMIHGITPNYLSSLVPPLVGDLSGYSLRNSGNIAAPFSRTKLYAESFLPSVIQLWNSLPQAVKNCSSLGAFKTSLDKQGVSNPPSYYYTGDRRAQVLHTRLRTNSSSLNLTLFQKNLTASPLCHCGNVESADHFLMHCPLYDNQRIELINAVNPICRPNSKTLLYGNSKLSPDSNTCIFSAVQKYLINTKRFL